MSSEEIPLTGGNVSVGIVRVGDTVRRPTGVWTPAVHALLRHLEEAGFAGAPRVLGIDERGREVLSFAPGDMAWPEHFGRLDDEGQLRRVGRLIRDYHDAVAGFRAPEDAYWQLLMPDGGDEIIAHHDLAPWNLALGDPQWVFIDWDGAGPGTRLGDLAYAVHGFVPLSTDPLFQRDDAGRRVRAMADAYGLDDEQDRRDLVGRLSERTRAMYALLAEQSALGTQPWTKLWQEGHGDVWLADSEYIEQREDLWLRALLD